MPAEPGLGAASRPQPSNSAPPAADEALLGVFAPSLYADHIKVYPRAVRGAFRNIKWLVLILCLGIYYMLPWLRWDRGPDAPSQALLLDMSGPRGYFFNIEIWPQEVYYITGLLILGAVALFLATALFGRVWCGYTCPQTVWTDLFLLVERWIEGDRNARIKLDSQKLTTEKFLRKTAKHMVWLLIAAATGGAWIMYFQDAPTVTREILTGQSSGATYFFFGLFTLTTYGLAGWAREQVCTYMCPWPRFQAAMQDEHSLIVTYQGWRGEQRGKHKAGESWDGRGDCIDCKACVHVCPTGIDIRNGPQLECIGCALCIDACDEVMAKVERPPRLIDFISLDNLERRAKQQPTKLKLLRTRTMLYASMLLIVAIVMTVALLLRSEMEFTVQQVRNPLYVALSDGSLRNGYVVKISNKTRAPMDLRLGTARLDGAELFLAGSTERSNMLDVSIAADSVGEYHVFVKAARSKAGGLINFDFVLRDRAGREAGRLQSQFAQPN
ncbi:cytochrome c oxidase accessory protein CcoG [Ferrovibrio sp.]|uniref:cytochrome c oxidase accessory protein CcoG n=1 Tax=Ferrovibrio sp. TaxID=1917215 RepID=UPI001B51D40F|nr:cytochrome c oxidase accessory protein CcoG [Ferrovibrio sp.]MBP7063671.1 cytochrome c oxidase accessory protein CcoG [Ferrovibrio sp.]